jgi:hypothetical protein
VLLASNLILERRNLGTKLPFKATPGRYIFAWVLVAIALVGGALLTWALPLTIIIELAVTYLFIRYLWPVRHKVFFRPGNRVISSDNVSDSPPPLLPLMTAVTSVNLLTQPILWFIAAGQTWGIPSALAWPVFFLELIVFLVETLLLRLTQWHHLKWADAFMLSFLMNLGSFVIGLLIAI